MITQRGRLAAGKVKMGREHAAGALLLRAFVFPCEDDLASHGGTENTKEEDGGRPPLASILSSNRRRSSSRSQNRSPTAYPPCVCFMVGLLWGGDPDANKFVAITSVGKHTTWQPFRPRYALSQFVADKHSAHQARDYPLRHCERSEAISLTCVVTCVDEIASLRSQ